MGRSADRPRRLGRATAAYKATAKGVTNARASKAACVMHTSIVDSSSMMHFTTRRKIPAETPAENSRHALNGEPDRRIAAACARARSTTETKRNGRQS